MMEDKRNFLNFNVGCGLNGEDPNIRMGHLAYSRPTKDGKIPSAVFFSWRLGQCALGRKLTVIEIAIKMAMKFR